MDLKLKELQKLCKEVAIYYSTERDMLNLAIELIGRQDKEELLKNKLKSLETVLKDKKTPQNTIDKAYNAYKILTSHLNVETKPITDFRKASIVQYSLNQIISKKEVPIKEMDKKIEDTYKELQGVVREELTKIDLETTEEKPEKLRDIREFLVEKVEKKEDYKPRKQKKLPKPKEKEGLSGIAIPIGVGVATVIAAAAVLGKKHIEIKAIENEIKEKQELCGYIIEKKDIKSLAEKLNGQTLYASDLSNIINKKIKPGQYKLGDLFSCLGHHFENEIKECLNNSKINVKKRKKIFNCPLDGKVIKKCYFGQIGRILGGIVSNRPHKGDDLCGITNDTIYAAGNGVVYKVDRKYRRGVGYGKKIVIQHDGNLKTLYAHLSKIYVEEGDSVKRGDAIGLEGRTGYATGPHLHFEVRKGKNIINPARHYEMNPSAQDVKENSSNAYIIYKILNKN